MAITWYTTSGQPSDTVGVAGDMAFDTANRIVWVKQASNTWVGGGYSNIGPTGPAMLSGSGAPSSSLGNNGNGYCDLLTGLTYSKSSNAWAQVGNILGPPGPAGYTGLTSQGSSAGASSGTTGTVITSTASAIPIPGTTLPLSFAPTQSSALMGVSYSNSGVANTISLVDTTASTTVFTSTVAASTNFVTSYTTTQYPLVAGHVYQWMIAGTGNAQYIFTPFYLMPTASSTPGVSMISGWTSAAATAFSATLIYTMFGVNTTLALSRVYLPYRAGSVVGWQGIYNPSTAGAAAANVTVGVYLYSQAAGTSSQIGSFTLANSGKYLSGTFSSPLALPVNNNLYLNFSGAGTGQVSADLLVTV